MSKERELLKKWLIECMWRAVNTSLLEETKELLAQPEQTEQEPLSDGEIRDGLDGKNGFENWYDDRFVDGVRFAEKAHGIGVKQ